MLRGIQFAARLEVSIEPKTAELCRRVALGDLPAERIWGEMEKLLLKAPRPSVGLDWADRLGVVQQLFPELAALKGCPQDPEWHPGGDVWVHTLLCMDRAVEELEGLDQAANRRDAGGVVPRSGKTRHHGRGRAIRRTSTSGGRCTHPRDAGSAEHPHLEWL